MTVTDEVLLPIIAEVQINAPIANVWEVMTGPAHVPGWLGCLNYTGQVGSTFHMQPDRAKAQAGDISGATHCDVVLLQQPHKLNFSWYMPGTPATLVELSLFSEGPDKSFVRLVHSGWDAFPASAVKGFHEQLTAGWRMGVLPNLKTAAEKN